MPLNIFDTRGCPSNPNKTSSTVVQKGFFFSAANRHALDILNLIKRLKITTLAVLHDLNLAAAFCDNLHVMHRGSILVNGPPEEALTPQLLLDIFAVGGIVGKHPVKRARRLQRQTGALASRRR